MMNLKGRNFLKLMDYTPEEILCLIDLAADLKKKKKEGILHDSLIGKNRNRVPWLRTGHRGGTCKIRRCSGLEWSD